MTVCKTVFQRITASVLLLFMLGLCLFCLPIKPAAMGDDQTLLRKRDIPVRIRREWRETDFKRTTVPEDGFRFAEAPKDGIRAIVNPRFRAVAAAGPTAQSPVITVTVGQVTRAYPLEILIWHEVVNDTLDGVPVAVTYSPFTNTTMVFDRRLPGGKEGDADGAGPTLTFGVSGHLRYGNLVLYDRESQSWWQQFTGTGIVGSHAGAALTVLPHRIENYGTYQARVPDGIVLAPPYGSQIVYGSSPYAGYDTLESSPYAVTERAPKRGTVQSAMADGMADSIRASRIVRVGTQAWPLPAIAQAGRLEGPDGLIFTWQPGTLSVLDSQIVVRSNAIGSVLVQRRAGDALEDVSYSLDFAYAYKAFYPDRALLNLP